MKNLRRLLTGVIMLAILATSGLAFATTTTVIPLNTAGDYYMGQEWHDSVTIAPGVTSAEFNMNVNLLGGTWDTTEEKNHLGYFSAAANSNIFIDHHHPDGNVGTFLITGMLDLTSGPGVYALSAIANDIWGENLTAHWTINSASVTTQSSATPIPAAFLLLGSGLAGLFGLKKKFTA
jgi:hypothetical protein